MPFTTEIEQLVPLDVLAVVAVTNDNYTGRGRKDYLGTHVTGRSLKYCAFEHEGESLPYEQANPRIGLVTRDLAERKPFTGRRRGLEVFPLFRRAPPTLPGQNGYVVILSLQLVGTFVCSSFFGLRAACIYPVCFDQGQLRAWPGRKAIASQNKHLMFVPVEA